MLSVTSRHLLTFGTTQVRDLLIVGMVLATLPFVLRHSWVGVLLWTWLSVMNPHKLAFGFAHDAPLAAIVAGVTLISLATSRDKLQIPWVPPVVVLVLFVVWMCLTTAFAIDPVGSWPQLSKVLKIQLMTVVALMVFKERKHIEFFVWINILSVGFYGFKGGIFTIMHGGRSKVWGPPGGFIEDNNALAVAIVMAIPLINYLRVTSNRLSVRFGLVVLMLLCALSALGSQSRGALLAILAMALILWYRSSQKPLLGIMIVIAASLLLAFMPASWEQRMGTIGTYEQDTSAMARLWAWEFCYNLANHRLLGGGFEIYNWANYLVYAPPQALAPQAAHSIYFSVLGEHGYVGLFLFLLIWGMTFRVAGMIREEARNRPDVLWVYFLAGMCQVSIVGYLVGGTFLSLAYFDLPYNILVILVVAQRWLREVPFKDEAMGTSGTANLVRSSETPSIAQPAQE